ncbi:hypothetical protein RYA05_05905 [Pseudomonas syringae pv. actinidiae]|nr:hypothetical protein [Pseudomonas syringae pv. actinidiae]
MFKQSGLYVKFVLFGVNPVLCFAILALAKNPVLAIASFAALSYLTCLIFDILKEKMDANRVLKEGIRSNNERDKREREAQSKKIAAVYVHVNEFWSGNFERISLADPGFWEAFNDPRRQDAQRKISKFYRDLLGGSVTPGEWWR